MKVSSVAEMRNLDRRATEEFGIPEEILMEDAGDAAYFVMLRETGIKDKKFVVFCGIGNNGGDGFVVARKIQSSGGSVKVFLMGDEKKLKGSAKKNFEILSKIGIDIKVVNSIDSIKSDVTHSDAVVDSIFGTGLTRDVKGIYRDVIQLINDRGKKVFSIDIPSGINGDTGEIMGCAVDADYTITLGLPKLGNVLYPGYERCGKLYLSHISFPPSLYDTEEIKVEINHPLELPERERDTHKGNCGKVLFMAGSSNYLGAPYFSALSFLKAGGGVSYLATPKSISSFLAIKGGEIVFLPQKETSFGSLAMESKDKILELSKRAEMVVMGPGVSLNEETQRLVRELADMIEKPLLIDGDGITAIAKDMDIIKNREEATILTPHMGEMSRITGMDVDQINRDKIRVLQKTAKELKAIIVLKGAHSLIGYPDESVFINMSGNPGMATAGSGDILTGTIAAIFGLGLPILNATRIGVLLHGLSGDLAAQEKGEDGITAEDILNHLPNALKHYREDFDKLSKDYGGVYMV